MKRKNELRAEQLRRVADAAALGIESTEHQEPLEGIIGQARAVSALRFGLGIHETGFNIYVSGQPGIGKMSALRSFLAEYARLRETPSDWCYLHNFEDPDRPRAHRLAPGDGRRLQQDMKALVDHVRSEVPKVFESEEYASKRTEIMQQQEKEKAKVLEQVTRRAVAEGLTVQMGTSGPVVLAATQGRAMDESELEALPAPERDEIKRRRDSMQQELKAAMKEVRELERGSREKLQDLDRQVALTTFGGLIDDLAEKYHANASVAGYLRAVKRDLSENIGSLKPAPPALTALFAPQAVSPELQFRKYEVNVLVDNSRQEGAPVVVESNPTYANLFGRVEKEARGWSVYTDFTMIKPGSLHRANGGYLVVRVQDLLRDFFSWEDLKRSLRSKQITIEDLGERVGLMTMKTQRPEPVPLEVKVLLVGRPLFYYLLHAYDEEFPELFKTKADFDTRMERNEENVREFLRFLGTFCGKEHLKHPDAGAAARLIEHASRLAEDQQKLSTHFGAIADVVREANYWAMQEDAPRIQEAHVKKAIDQKVYRSDLIRKHIEEYITRGMLLVDTAGEAVGQVNGLAVINLGDHQFGRPSRITASVGPGREGIIDIEREVKLGGPLHTKGVLILSGYIAQKYAVDAVLTLAARLVFEQSYEEIDGDSASSAELYTILSALSGLPIRQGLAVTGSVNQRGDVQAIGGANQKIEGFFDLCAARGLTGEQGVMIPWSNVDSLMLREDVVEAVRAKRFHLWAVSTIDEGIEVLTGVPAGERRRNGHFPKGTVGYLVERRLREFTASVRALGATATKKTRAGNKHS